MGNDADDICLEWLRARYTAIGNRLFQWDIGVPVPRQYLDKYVRIDTSHEESFFDVYNKKDSDPELHITLRQRVHLWLLNID